MRINPPFWKGKKVLITGHTGFKGSWLSLWLHRLGAQVTGYGLDPYTERGNFVLSKLSDRICDIRGDVRDLEHLEEVFEMTAPEIVFHLAAQPLVRLSYEEPKTTYETNIMGTVNVLERIRNSKSVKVAVMITTDKCYENKETLTGYKETDAFGGYDPYSASKACDEIIINSYRSSFLNPEEIKVHGKALASVRAGNVIGGGDWSKDRIIPDCIRALEAEEPVKIRSPKAIRPWQFVLEPLAGYLLLAEKMYEDSVSYAQGWNFGPEEENVADVWTVAKELLLEYGEGHLIDVSGEKKPHEAMLLKLDITKAKEKLGWRPRLDLKETIAWTTEWYRSYREKNVYELCIRQIEEYMTK